MDVHAQGLEIGQEDVERAQLMLEAFMFPNRAETQQEKDVLLRAARFQAAHDLTLAQETPNLPGYVRSFQIGHFQMTMDPDSRVSRQDVCPSAYALLLREGFLYRGVEGRHSRAAPPPPAAGQAEAAGTAVLAPSAPPLRPGVKTRNRDAWLPHDRRVRGNPPPRGIAPQGMPPLPGLPRNVKTGEGDRDAADGIASDYVPHPPVSP